MKTSLLFAATTCAVMTVGGCSGGVGSAADVTCKNFNGMSVDDQKRAVLHMVEERGDTDRSELNLVRIKLRISSGCLNPENMRARIGDLAGAGQSPQFLHEH